MYAAFAFMAAPATRQPSTSLCGSWRMISRSLQVPGSDSSALTTRYCGPVGCLGMNDHFRPVPNPAPPQAAVLDLLDQPLTPLEHEVLGPVPIAPLARGLEAPRLLAVEIGEDPV